MSKLNIGGTLAEVNTWFNKSKIIKKQVKKDNNIIYGGQSIKKQIGIFARRTIDYDIISKKPRRSAVKLEKTLDRKSKGNFYFTKPAFHPGTFKVKHKGRDMKPNTRADLEVADFSKPERKFKTVKIEGIRYVTLGEVKKDKRKSLSDPASSFRHAKDKEDLERMKMAGR